MRGVDEFPVWSSVMVDSMRYGSRHWDVETVSLTLALKEAMIESATGHAVAR